MRVIMCEILSIYSAAFIVRIWCGIIYSIRIIEGSGVSPHLCVVQIIIWETADYSLGSL